MQNSRMTQKTDEAIRLSRRYVTVRVASDNPSTHEYPHEGGSITFSPDVNVDVKGLRAAVESKIRTWLARWGLARRVHRVVIEVSEETKQGVGYTLGPKSRGHYVAPGQKPYREVSYRVDLGGIDSETLDRLAEGLRKNFRQQSVFVHDHNRRKSYLWFGTDEKKPAEEPAEQPDESSAEPSPWYDKKEVAAALRRSG